MRTSNPNYGRSKKLHACIAHKVFTSNDGISKKSHACTAHKVIVRNGSDPIDNSDTVHTHHPSTRLPKRQNETLSGASEKEAQECQVYVHTHNGGGVPAWGERREKGNLQVKDQHLKPKWPTQESLKKHSTFHASASSFC